MSNFYRGRLDVNLLSENLRPPFIYSFTSAATAFETICVMFKI